MKITYKKILSYSFVILIIASLSSCVNKDFDTPPTGGVDPVMTGTYTTIAALKALYPVANYNTAKITNDVYISGIVIADDQSGNFYKELVLEDSTGGISVVIDESNYYTTYKIGRRVFVKCNNLYMGNYNGILQIGAGDDGTGSLLRIASTLIPKFVLPGSYYHYVTPKTIQISSAHNPAYLNTLVKIENVQFANIDTTFADAPTKTDRNLDINDCLTNSILIRSSGYANFASSNVPTGRGSITAVLQIYGSDLQLKIRDLTDLNMTGTRCGSTGPVGTGGLMNISDVRTLIANGPAVFVSGTKIRGTVISDKNTFNITGNNLVMQDATAGIVVRFTSANTFNLNDSIEVDLSGDSLTTFSSLLQINYASLASVTLKGTGTVIPKTATTSQILANGNTWESTLLKITGVTLSGGGTYSGTVVMTDASGILDLYTRPGASFSGVAYPTTQVSVTGYLNNFSGTYELNIRGTADVQ